ncbi:hypothetical protein BGW36DRAFT_392113 [Talaromyces proteolyticus]|uniref:Uncharacterized protein n=1 Tax=Talaromyces proteolyticus TaxID=1131652 RepID=A0AAD4KG78_9EURO|nr:uncharacterized protein BGW36DRAFT_392113 [Talaromyces proteolyticus]KAH8688751.1 hypothetical protein BGW36DRAFT_392113 [Talaromyces proteolyticus]
MYSSTLFSMVGFKKLVAVSIAVCVTNFLFGFANITFLDLLVGGLFFSLLYLGWQPPWSWPPSHSTASLSTTAWLSKLRTSTGPVSSFWLQLFYM